MKLVRLLHSFGGRSRRRRFTELMNAVDEVAEINKYAVPSIARAVARPMQARILAKAILYPQHQAQVSADFDKLFFPDHVPVSADGRSLAELQQRPPQATAQPLYRLALSRDVLLPWAWHRRRLVSALASIGSSKTSGAWRCDLNHQVQILLPFGLALVHGGNHSIAAGIVDGEGEVFAEPRDLSVVYDHVRYDGIAFVREHDGRRLNTPSAEEPGMLFEIGRKMLQHGVEYDAEQATKADRVRDADARRFEVLYQVHLNGKDTSFSIRTGAIETALQDAGISRSDPRWKAVLYEGEPFSDTKANVWTFRPYGPRPMVQALAHVPHGRQT